MRNEDEDALVTYTGETQLAEKTSPLHQQQHANVKFEDKRKVCKSKRLLLYF